MNQKFFTALSFASLVLCTIVSLATPLSVFSFVMFASATANAFYFILNFCKFLEQALRGKAQIDPAG
jgi:hypothetical protein